MTLKIVPMILESLLLLVTLPISMENLLSLSVSQVTNMAIFICASQVTFSVVL